MAQQTVAADRSSANFVFNGMPSSIVVSFRRDGPLKGFSYRFEIRRPILDA
jgi:hypothetical protein